MYCIFFLSVCVLTHTEKKKKKIPSDYGQQVGRGCSMVLYMALLRGFFVFVEAEKTKKNCSGEGGGRVQLVQVVMVPGCWRR